MSRFRKVFCKVNLKDTTGKKDSEILSAATKCRPDKIYKLADDGANVDARNKSGRTALMLATLKNHRPTVIALLELGANIDLCDPKGKTALLLALQNNCDRVIGTLTRYQSRYYARKREEAESIREVAHAENAEQDSKIVEDLGEEGKPSGTTKSGGSEKTGKRKRWNLKQIRSSSL